MVHPARQEPIEIRAPLPLHIAIDRYAEATGACRSAAVRELLQRSLSQLGLWPPQIENIQR